REREEQRKPTTEPHHTRSTLLSNPVPQPTPSCRRCRAAAYLMPGRVPVEPGVPPNEPTLPPISPRFLNTMLNITETPGVTSAFRMPDCVIELIKAMHSSW